MEKQRCKKPPLGAGFRAKRIPSVGRSHVERSLELPCDIARHQMSGLLHDFASGVDHLVLFPVPGDELVKANSEAMASVSIVPLFGVCRR